MDRLAADSKQWFRLAGAVSSGLLITAAFPRLEWAVLAWIGLVPLLLALNGLTSLRSGFRLAFIAGLVHYLGLTYWLAHTMRSYGHLPIYLAYPLLFLLAAYLALYWGAFGAWVAGCRAPRLALLLIPAGWTGLEYLRARLLTGFPWELLGYTQYRSLHLIQISDIIGVYGISFLILLANSAACFLIVSFWGKTWNRAPVSRRFGLAATAAFGLALALTGGYGEFRLNATRRQMAQAPQVKVAVIQGNIPQGDKWKPAAQNRITEKYRRISLFAAQKRPDLIVWPETATPFYFQHDRRLTARVKAAVRQSRTDYLIGSPAFVRRQNRTDFYNSAYLVNGQGQVKGKYDKAHLVPYGEYVPLQDWFPFIGKMVEEVGDFKAGKPGQTLSWREFALGVQICYEIIFPGLSRQMARNGAHLLLNLTNDAWYGMSSAPYQHFSMTVLRAAENKRSLARAANTGISGFVAPTGEILGTTPIFKQRVLLQTLPLLEQKTLYSRYGDGFAICCLMLIILGSIVWMQTKTRR